MKLKNLFGKLYNKIFKSLKGSGLSKYQKVVKIHRFFTRQFKSDYVEVFGSKLYLDKNDEGGYSGDDFYKRYYFDLLEKEICPGEHVIDIGAKIGIYTLALSKFVGTSGTVTAFEPTPESFTILEKNKRINHLDNIIIEQKAVSYKNTTEILEICEFVGNNRINNNCKNGISVQCVSLDDYFLDNPKKISFIKIDVEGLEPEVLLGMKNILNKTKNLKLLLEYNPKLLKFFGKKPEKILEDLTNQGFLLFDLEYNQTHSVDVKHFVTKYNNTHKLTNILAIRK